MLARTVMSARYPDWHSNFSRVSRPESLYLQNIQVMRWKQGTLMDIDTMIRNADLMMYQDKPANEKLSRMQKF